MSVGRISTFLDIYVERDLENGVITEAEAQELVDHIVMKFRMVKFARITSYQELFSGDPVWATLEVGGTGLDGRSMVTKNDYRFLHTLENMGPSPEPNMTVLYTSRLPEAFKKYAAHISIVSSSIQYENDDVMKPVWGDDYSICCCVSATQTGKEMQFFGARANLLKALLYAINGGMDEKLKTQVGPCYAPITTDELTWDIVKPAYLRMLDWLAGLYVNVLNLIHYMHDKYYYEAAEMALIDTHVKRSFATGIAGFSHCVDSISALKYAKVTAIRDESGMVYDYKTEGEFPKYGNDDDRADDIAKWLLKTFIDMVKKHHTYRNSEPSTSILTITSNVVYGKATGSTPDGRRAWTPLAPGANPSYGAEQRGGTANCYVVISDDDIGAPLGDQMDDLIVMNDPSLNKFLYKLVPGGTLYINSSIVKSEITRTDIKVVKAPVTELALEMGSAKVLNIIMLGVYVGYTQVVPEDVVWRTIEHKLGKKPALLPLNRQAFDLGLKLGREQR